MLFKKRKLQNIRKRSKKTLVKVQMMATNNHNLLVHNLTATKTRNNKNYYNS